MLIAQNERHELELEKMQQPSEVPRPACMHIGNIRGVVFLLHEYNVQPLACMPTALEYNV